MKILVLGGTQFVGRHTVHALLAAGHTLSVLNRGRSRDELPAGVERLLGDRDAGAAGLAAVAGRSWDVCIDVSGYTPRQVRTSAERLHGKVGRYVFISAVSVYGDPEQRPVLETQPRLAPASEDTVDVTEATYGRLKVACEDIVRALYAERCTLLRPQVVVGQHDPTVRYAFWQQRALRGGEMLAPGDGSDHVQVIDVRDLARFVVTVVDNDLGGAFNLAGPRLSWAAFMDVLGARNLVWVPAAILQSAGLGFAELPLFRPERGARSSLMDVSPARARAAGLVLTAPEVTARDLAAWSLGRDLASALAPAREAELLRLARC